MEKQDQIEKLKKAAAEQKEIIRRATEAKISLSGGTSTEKENLDQEKIKKLKEEEAELGEKLRKLNEQIDLLAEQIANLPDDEEETTEEPAGPGTPILVVEEKTEIEPEQNLGDYAEVARLIRFYVEHPNEAMAPDHNFLLKRYPNLKTKIEEIENDRRSYAEAAYSEFKKTEERSDKRLDTMNIFKAFDFNKGGGGDIPMDILKKYGWSMFTTWYDVNFDELKEKLKKEGHLTLSNKIDQVQEYIQNVKNEYQSKLDEAKKAYEEKRESIDKESDNNLKKLGIRYE